MHSPFSLARSVASIRARIRDTVDDIKQARIFYKLLRHGCESISPYRSGLIPLHLAPVHLSMQPTRL